MIQHIFNDVSVLIINLLQMQENTLTKILLSLIASRSRGPDEPSDRVPGLKYCHISFSQVPLIFSCVDKL